MGFQYRAHETQLAKSAWLLELAEHWSERDPAKPRLGWLGLCVSRKGKSDCVIKSPPRDALITGRTSKPRRNIVRNRMLWREVSSHLSAGSVYEN